MMIQFTITRAVILLVSFYSFVSVQSFSYVTSSAFVTNTAAAEAATVSASERIPARNIGSSSSGRNGNTVLSMAGGGGVRRRGLEQRRETITPTGRYYSAWVTSRHLFFLWSFTFEFMFGSSVSVSYFPCFLSPGIETPSSIQSLSYLYIYALL